MLFGVRSHCECGVCGCSMHALFPPTFLQHLQVCASGLPALALSSLSVRWHRNRSHEGTLSVRFFPSLSKWGSLGRFVLVSPLHPFVPAVSLQRSCVITACNTSFSNFYNRALFFFFIVRPCKGANHRYHRSIAEPTFAAWLCWPSRLKQ